MVVEMIVGIIGVMFVEDVIGFYDVIVCVEVCNVDELGKFVIVKI